MRLFINEDDYDSYDDYNDYEYRPKGERNNFEIYYATYYKDMDNYETNFAEQEGPFNDDVEYSDSDDPWTYVIKNELDINNRVEKGDYPGLWVFHIIIPVYSDIRQIDVDKFIGNSNIIESDIKIDKRKIKFPEDYDEDTYTLDDLRDYVDDIIYEMKN